MITSSSKPVRRLIRWNLVSAGAGAIVWALLLSPLSRWLDLSVESGGETWLIEKLLLLAVLVITPLARALTATPNHNGNLSFPYRAAVLTHPLAAALVALSFFTRTGLRAGLLTLGWALGATFIAWSGLSRLLGRRSLSPIEGLCIDAGLAYITVGSAWLFLSRCGLNPLGFSNTIVLLTAAHFHYAGFAAPILVGLAGRELKRVKPSLSRLFWIPAAGVIAGPPMVATGITFSRLIEMISAMALALSMMTLAMIILFAIVPALKNRVAQLLLIISANAVIVTMVFAWVYAVGRYAAITTVIIPTMAWVHGLTNALGFVFCGLLAWLIEHHPGPDDSPKTVKLTADVKDFIELHEE